MRQGLLSIEEASSATGLGPEDIEYAEQTGLLASGREAEGYYTSTQIKSMESIARLLDLGLSVDDISGLDLPPDVIPELREYLAPPRAGRQPAEFSTALIRASIHIIRSHETVVDRQAEELQELRQSLDRKARALGKLLDALDERTRRAA